MSTSHHDKHAPFRWDKWQEYYRGKETLTPAAAAQGYTLLKVRRSLRPARTALLERRRAHACRLERVARATRASRRSGPPCDLGTRGLRRGGPLGPGSRGTVTRAPSSGFGSALTAQ